MSRTLPIALLLALLTLQGCQTTPNQAGVALQPEDGDAVAPPQVAETIPPISGGQVGLLVPLSGAHGNLGRELFDAASLALFDIGRDDIELVVADTGNGDAERAARQVLAARVDVVIGPVFSRSVQDAAPVLRASERNTFVFSSDLAVAEPGIFVMGHASENQVKRLVDHAVAAGHLRFAVLAPRSAYGERMAETLRKAAREAGGLVTAEVFHDPDGAGIDESVMKLADTPVRQSDVDAALAALRNSDSLAAEMAIERLSDPGRLLAFDALLVPESGPLMQRIAAWMGYHDIDSNDIQLLGLDTWNDPALFREPVMNGAWYAMSPDSGRSTLLRRFRETFGYEAKSPVTLAYDAVALVSALVAGNAERSITDWRGFGGLDGPFRFNSNGRSERQLAIIRITPDGPVIEDPAPTGFTARQTAAAEPGA